MKQTAFRFTTEDLAVLEALKAKTGIQTQVDVVRLALRTLAKDQGIDLAKTKTHARRRRGAA
jgi:hypothetical protein